MFDFNKFIEVLNNHNEGFRDALSIISDDFHIGKIETKANDLSECLECIIDSKYRNQIISSYAINGFVHNFYKNSDNHIYTEEELMDINLLLRIISLYHQNYILLKKASEGELISFNTKLPNVHGYLKNVNMIAPRINANDYYSYFINLKGFGLVNKMYSSEFGDKAIVYYANRLKEFIMQDEAIGHLGGDNFVAFIKKERHDDFISLVTNVNVDLKINNIKASLTLVGIVGYAEVDEKISYGTIISNPSIALQYAKASKKLVVKLTPELYEMVNSVKNIENTFKDELKQGNFLVYYQPKFDIETGKIVGVEALSRWKNKDKVVPPGMFVPILEKNGEIIELDLFVLETLCSDISNYRNQGYTIVPASCNLSRRDFENDDIEERVINIIKRYNVKTEDIIIEVTETTSLQENERLAKFINTMWKNGIMTSIDDFGTGYSSLSVLRDFKVNEIKIDRSFINRESLNKSDEIIIGSIIDMAKRLNISVICEGVETKKQAEFLVKLGCYKAQGFYYSKPVPKLEFESMLQTIGTVYD